MNDEENARFLALFDESGLKNRSQFITSCIFDRQLKVVKIDKATMDYYMRPTTFHSQFRAIGVNYNQITKALVGTGDKRVSQVTVKIIELTQEFEAKRLQK